MLFSFLIVTLLIMMTIYYLLRAQRRGGQATRRRRNQEKKRFRLNAKSKLEVPPLQESNWDVVSDQKVNENPTEMPSDTLKQKTSEDMGYVIFYVMAPEGNVFTGYELLQALLANGLRYGERNIFHRYETKTDVGKVMFSVASVNTPGTFELTKMGSFDCPGLALFMVLNTVTNPMTAFDVMLETARQLAEDMKGEVWGADRRPLNMDKVAQLRACIRRHIETQAVPDFFEQV